MCWDNYICMSVCYTITYKILDLESSFLVCMYIFQVPKFTLKFVYQIKVTQPKIAWMQLVHLWFKCNLGFFICQMQSVKVKEWQCFAVKGKAACWLIGHSQASSQHCWLNGLDLCHMRASSCWHATLRPTGRNGSNVCFSMLLTVIVINYILTTNECLK